MLPELLSILFKCDVRMDFISQMFFQDQFQFISLLAQPLRFSFYRSTSVILVVFLLVISRPKKSFSSKSCPLSGRFMVLASYYPLDLFHSSDFLFLSIRSMSGVVFPFLFTGGHHSSYRSLFIPVLRSIVL